MDKCIYCTSYKVNWPGVRYSEEFVDNDHSFGRLFTIEQLRSFNCQCGHGLTTEHVSTHPHECISMVHPGANGLRPLFDRSVVDEDCHAFHLVSDKIDKELINSQLDLILKGDQQCQNHTEATVDSDWVCLQSLRIFSP